MPDITTALPALLLWAALGYLLGSIPFGVLLSKAMGLDAGKLQSQVEAGRLPERDGRNHMGDYWLAGSLQRHARERDPVTARLQARHYTAGSNKYPEGTMLNPVEAPKKRRKRA